MAFHNQTPVLGICVGMQMMARFSEEGNVEGQGWLNADVIKLDNRPFLSYMSWKFICFKGKYRAVLINYLNLDQKNKLKEN